MKRSSFLFFLVSALALRGTAFGADAPPPAGKPNIIFIMADQWRKQALGFMNQDKVFTPNLDRLAAQGAAFENAYSTVAVCTPNRACLLTGKYSLHNGVLCNETWLMPQNQTLGDVCKSNGYQTAYFGKWHLGQTGKRTSEADAGYVPLEFRHGFDFWYKEEGHKPFDQPTFMGDSKKSVNVAGWEPDNLVGAAKNYLAKRDKTKPFCMVMSFGPPHTGGGKGFEDRYQPGLVKAKNKSKGVTGPALGYGYAAPAEYEKLYAPGGEFYQRPVRANVEPLDGFEECKCVQGYYGAITAIDAALGQLMETLKSEGIADDTIVIFTADHGEMMGSHGRMTKDSWLQEASGIPLIISYPGKIKPLRSSSVVDSVDFVPTVLGLSGLTIPAEMDGTDFSPLLCGKPMKTPEYAFGDFFMGGYGEPYRQYRAVFSERYTYVLTHGVHFKWAGAPEVLYDRQQDPYEMKPILRGQGQDALMDQFKTVLADHLKKLNDPFIEKVWAGGPGAAAPDTSFYDTIINGSFPDDPKLRQSKKDNP